MDPFATTQIYNAIFRRNSVFVPTIFIGAFAFSIGFDQITTQFWDKHNKGVSRHETAEGRSIEVGPKTSPVRSVFRPLLRTPLDLKPRSCNANPFPEAVEGHP